MRTVTCGRVGYIALVCILCVKLSAQVNVTTYHNDNSRTGQNTQEKVLAPANVNSTQFGKLYSVGVEGCGFTPNPCIYRT